MAKQKIKVNRKRLVLFYILVFLAIYFIVSIVRLFEKPVDTVLIKKGELINYEEVVGYIIRDEELLDLSNYEGIVKSEVQDATRISKGSAILKYVSKSEEQIMEKINKLNEKIEVAKENQQTIFSNDVKIIDSEIENNIYSQIKNILANENFNINSCFYPYHNWDALFLRWNHVKHRITKIIRYTWAFWKLFNFIPVLVCC